MGKVKSGQSGNPRARSKEALNLPSKGAHFAVQRPGNQTMV